MTVLISERRTGHDQESCLSTTPPRVRTPGRSLLPLRNAQHCGGSKASVDFPGVVCWAWPRKRQIRNQLFHRKTSRALASLVTIHFTWQVHSDRVSVPLYYSRLHARTQEIHITACALFAGPHCSACREHTSDTVYMAMA